MAPTPAPDPRLRPRTPGPPTPTPAPARPALTPLLPAGTEKSRGAQALAVSPNRRYLAVSETVAEQPVLTVYELSSVPARRRRTLAAAELPAREAVALAFSPDCRYLAAATAPPEGHLTYWLWEKQRLMAAVRLEAPGSGVCQVRAAALTGSPGQPRARPAPPGLAGGRGCARLPPGLSWACVQHRDSRLAGSSGACRTVSRRWRKGSNFSSPGTECQVARKFSPQDMRTVPFPVVT